MRIRFWPKTGSEALQSLPSFEVQSPGSGFWSQPDPHPCFVTQTMKILDNFKGFLFVFILLVSDILCKPWIRIQAGFLYIGHQWNVWHQWYENKNGGFGNYLRYAFKRIFTISLRSIRGRDPDPFLTKIVSTPLVEIVGPDTVSDPLKCAPRILIRIWNWPHCAKLNIGKEIRLANLCFYLQYY